VRSHTPAIAATMPDCRNRSDPDVHGLKNRSFGKNV
jgi:hypothetical protein